MGLRNASWLVAGSAAAIGTLAMAAPRPAVKAPVRPQQKVIGPVADYWVSAATTSGTGIMAMGGAKPSIGAMMRMMRGGTQVTHALVLQLGSARTSPDPKADHTPGALAPLPLATPKVPPPATPAESVEEQPTMAERPKGRLLIYWGCGEHAGPGQPLVIDFSRIGTGQPLPHLPFVAVHHQNPPSPGRYATYGEWPNAQSRARPPATLVGDHLVHGSYTPDIRFALPPGQDYMLPLALSASGRTPAGATQLAWTPVSGATGYYAALFGGGQGAGGEASVVMWSSSAVQSFAGGGLLDYLAPAEVRRLIGQRVVLPPTQTSCTVPLEVTQAAPVGLLQMIAYGGEADFADPPRPADPRVPWNVNWTVKVRFKSTAGMMLGMPGAGAAAAGSGPSAGQVIDAAPRKHKGGLFNSLIDAANAVPH